MKRTMSPMQGFLAGLVFIRVSIWAWAHGLPVVLEWPTSTREETP